jgi:hypothetical protein
MNDATVLRHRTIRGVFTVPAVAYDNSASGLSADGRTLVLIRPRVTLGQKRTHLLVLDARRLKVLRRVTLPGDFSFDAISPDGSAMYLVNYLSLSRRSFDPTKYAVRSFDLRTGRLDPAPIVDPRQPGEKMGGLPATRAMSPDGRWAYTLYSGADHPFVHALDTTGRTARCIDLDALTGREDLFQMRMEVSRHGGELAVLLGNRPLALVDTTTFAVRAPRPAAPAARPAAPAADGGRPWLLLAAIAVLVLLGLGALVAGRAGPLARGARAR